MVSRRGRDGWNLTQPLGPYPSLDHQVLAFGPGYETALLFSATPDSTSEGAFYLEDRSGTYTEVIKARRRRGGYRPSPHRSRLER